MRGAAVCQKTPILPCRECRGEQCSPANLTQQRFFGKVSHMASGHGRTMCAPTRHFYDSLPHGVPRHGDFCLVFGAEDLLQRRPPPAADTGSRSRRGGRRRQAAQDAQPDSGTASRNRATAPKCRNQQSSGLLVSPRESPIFRTKRKSVGTLVLALFCFLRTHF